MSFRSISVLTISSCPFSTAYKNSIWPCSVFVCSGWTPPRSKSIFTTSSCPFIDSQVRAVIPMQLDPLASRSFMSNTVEAMYLLGHEKSYFVESCKSLRPSRSAKVWDPAISISCNNGSRAYMLIKSIEKLQCKHFVIFRHPPFCMPSLVNLTIF